MVLVSYLEAQGGQRGEPRLSPCFGMGEVQSFQKPVIGEYTSNYTKDPYMIRGLYLNKGRLEALEQGIFEFHEYP